MISLFNDRTLAVFHKGISYNEFVKNFIASLPEKARIKWSEDKGSLSVCAKNMVLNQLEERLNELNSCI